MKGDKMATVLISTCAPLCERQVFCFLEGTALVNDGVLIGNWFSWHVFVETICAYELKALLITPW